MEIKVPDQTVRMRNSEDEVILEASLLDIHAFIGFHTFDDQINLEDDHVTAEFYINKIKALVEPFNREFNCNLTWGQLNVLLNNLNQEEENLKKN